MSDTLNMKEITIAQFKNLIREQMEDQDLTPVVGIGKSGVGKTESIFELTQELGIGFCELRLVTMTETDLLGIPTINEFGRTDWASNNLLPDEKRDGAVGILVLDEITSATSTIRAAAYQLLDSKRSLGNYHLPPKWLVVGLGNGPSDGGVFSGMESAFLSRCRCWRIEPDLKSWKKWAVDKGVNPTVIAFLSSMPDFLHKLDPDEMASVFPCPRSWVSLSKKLNAREARNKGPLDQESVDIYTASCVGADVASTFGAFYAYNKSIVSVDDILDGKADTNIGRIESQVMYIIVQNLVRSLNNILTLGQSGMTFSHEAEVKVANACNWVVGVGNQSLDLAVMALTDLSQNVPLFAVFVIQDENFDSMCPKFLQFVKDNRIVFKAPDEI